MTLSEYMAQHRLKDEDMAAKLGCERTYVLKLRHGKQKPSLTLACAISELTEGAVQPADWLDLSDEAA